VLYNLQLSNRHFVKVNNNNNNKYKYNNNSSRSSLIVIVVVVIIMIRRFIADNKIVTSESPAARHQESEEWFTFGQGGSYLITLTQDLSDQLGL